MEYKINLLSPSIYSTERSSYFEDEQSEKLALYIKSRAVSEYKISCKFDQCTRLADVEQCEKFEEIILNDSEYVIIIASPKSQLEFDRFLNKLDLILENRSVWKNRFLFAIIGNVEIPKKLVVNLVINFELNEDMTSNCDSWNKLLKLIEVPWIPYNDQEMQLNEEVNLTSNHEIYYRNVATQHSTVIYDNYSFVLDHKQQSTLSKDAFSNTVDGFGDKPLDLFTGIVENDDSGFHSSGNNVDDEILNEPILDEHEENVATCNMGDKNAKDEKEEFTEDIVDVRDRDKFVHQVDEDTAMDIDGDPINEYSSNMVTEENEFNDGDKWEIMANKIDIDKIENVERQYNNDEVMTRNDDNYKIIDENNENKGSSESQEYNDTIIGKNEQCEERMKSRLRNSFHFVNEKEMKRPLLLRWLLIAIYLVSYILHFCATKVLKYYLIRNPAQHRELIASSIINLNGFIRRFGENGFLKNFQIACATIMSNKSIMNKTRQFFLLIKKSTEELNDRIMMNPTNQCFTWLIGWRKNEPSTLKNTKETCYMNSMLQALASSNQLIQQLDVFSECIPDNNKLREFVNLLKGINRPRQISSADINTKDIIKFVRAVKWDRTSQQDAFQLLSFFINAIHREIGFKEMMPPKLRILHEFSQGAHLNKVQYHLALALPLCGHFAERPGVQITALMDAFFQSSTIDDGPDTTSMYLFDHTPDVMIVHIQANEWSAHLGMYIKPTYFITYDSTLKYTFKVAKDISGSRFENIKAKYKLLAVVHHMGDVSGGHYITYRRHGNDWYLTNDEQVQKVPFKCEIIPYIMVYEKIEETIISKLIK